MDEDMGDNERMVMDAVRRITGRNRAACRVPDHALLREIKAECAGMPVGLVLPSVRTLERAGLVRTGRTVNDLYVAEVETDERH